VGAVPKRRDARAMKAEQGLLAAMDDLKAGLGEPVPEGTAREILEAAEELLTSEGVARFSMRAIANRVGVSLASLQYYYATRTELLRAFFDFKAACYVAQLEEQLERLVKNPEAGLRSTVRFLLDDSTCETTGVLYTQLWALACHDEEARAALDAHMRLYVKFFELLVARINPTLRAPQVLRRAVALVSMIEGFPWAVSGSGCSEAELRRTKAALVDMAFRLAAS